MEEGGVLKYTRSADGLKPLITAPGKTLQLPTVFKIPSSSAGLIIGSKGKNIRKIEEEAKLERYSIDIPRYETVLGMRTVSIKGQKCNCSVAKRKIKELVEFSIKRNRRRESGQSVGAGRKEKHLSFMTFLKDSDEIEFKYYNGIHPSNWRSDNLYFLQACQQVTCMPPSEDIHHRLRNYHKLQESLHKAMEDCLRSDPTYLQLEARFGKVLWRSDGQRCVSDELLRGRHKIEDLEKGGKVSVEDVLGKRDTTWDFQPLLSDGTIPECVKDAEFPKIGDAYRIDITMLYSRGSVPQEYLIRMKQNGENFEILEVLLTPCKPYIFDCLNLERDLDVRIANSYSPQNDKPEAVAEMKAIAEELRQGMALRDDCLHAKEPPGCTIRYARRGKHTMYLVSHHDKVYGECLYILAHYHQVKDCSYREKSESAAGGMEVKLQLKNEHHEMELWNCQWMADFAVLVGRTPEEVFALKCCDPAKIKVHPKDKSEVTAASVIRELDSFVGCALELALIDRD